MKLTIERTALLKALGHVQSVVERRNTIPILSNVLLTAEREQVGFSATDLDMEIIDQGVARVDVPGQITAPAHTLYEIVRKLPEGADVSLSFTGDDPRLQVQAGRSKFNLPVLPAGDFPVMSSDGLSARIPVDANDLARLIDKTRFAISTEETRYYLNGLYVHTVVDNGEAKLRWFSRMQFAAASSDLALGCPERCSRSRGSLGPRLSLSTFSSRSFTFIMLSQERR
jgi:DNA polymerase-3 subunit beta